MNNLDKQYTDLLQDILDNGVKKQTRNGEVLSVFGRTIRHKMSEGFPLLTTKKLHWKSIVGELLWFLRGDTDIRYLWENGISIWDGDWYKKYKTTCSEPYTLEEVKQKVKDGNHNFHDSMFDMGPIYGMQWRNWSNYRRVDSVDEVWSEYRKEDPIDQIANSIHLLKTNPDSRRNRVSSWNVGELDSMVLPPCHTDFQFFTRELSLEERIKQIPYSEKHTIFEEKECIEELRTLNGEELQSFQKYIKEQCDKINIPTRAISLMWNQRSVDFGLGAPFNIASYGLLLEIIAKEVNMVPDELMGNLGDVHLYLDHVEPIKEQLNREPYPLPTLKIENEVKWKEGDCLPTYSIGDFTLENYQSHPTIKLPLSN